MRHAPVHHRRPSLLLGAAIAIFVATHLPLPCAQAQEQIAPALADAAGPAEEAPSLAEAFFIQRHRRTGEIEPLGTLLIWLLLGASVGSWGLMATLHRANRRSRFMANGLGDAAREAFARRDPASLRARLDEEGIEGTHLAALLREMIDSGGSDPDAMSDALARAAEEHGARRLRRVEVLSTIGAIAPMVGLFGTVYGMILAFQEIVAAGGSPDPVGLAAGIGTALTTTFWGLVVAIPALAGSALLRTRIDALSSEAELAAERALAALADAEAPESSGERGASDGKNGKARRKLAG
jgi:biopolymer transport protein ExbB